MPGNSHVRFGERRAETSRCEAMWRCAPTLPGAGPRPSRPMATVRQRAGAGAPGRAQRSGAPMLPGGVPPGCTQRQRRKLGDPGRTGRAGDGGARPLATAREQTRGRGRVGLATRGVGDMLSEDRLACIVPTDGTIGGEAPALPAHDHAATLGQPVGTVTATAGPPFTISLVPVRSNTVGGPGWGAGREAYLAFE